MEGKDVILRVVAKDGRVVIMENDARNATAKWSAWLPFPDPRHHGILTAPIGAGCYELRRTDIDEKVLFGRSKNVAYRMTSLLPGEWGQGGRNNAKKRQYVFDHVNCIEYRTIACVDEQEAKNVESQFLMDRSSHRFPT